MTYHRYIPRYRIAIVAALSCFLGMAPGADALDRVLEGAKGDRVTIRLAKGKRNDASTVALCLRDRTGDGTARAFDIRATATPRFWTRRGGAPACGKVSDTAHTISFFSRGDDTGRVREILRTRLDLAGLSGRRVDLVWTAAGP